MHCTTCVFGSLDVLLSTWEDYDWKIRVAVKSHWGVFRWVLCTWKPPTYSPTGGSWYEPVWTKTIGLGEKRSRLYIQVKTPGDPEKSLFFVKIQKNHVPGLRSIIRAFKESLGAATRIDTFSKSFSKGSRHLKEGNIMDSRNPTDPSTGPGEEISLQDFDLGRSIGRVWSPRVLMSWDELGGSRWWNWRSLGPFRVMIFRFS